MRAESEMLNSGINAQSEGGKKVEIKNLELLQYYAYKMNEIYNYRSAGFFKSINRNLVNAERWKMLRNVCVVILYFSILFVKPGWCQRNPDVTSDCTQTHGNEGGNTIFYVIAPFEYLDLYNFEMTSWVLMLILIIYDLILVDINPRLIIVYCFLLLGDIICAQLFFQKMVDTNLNLLFRVAFVSLYTLNYQKIHSNDRYHFRDIPLASQKTHFAVRLFRVLLWDDTPRSPFRSVNQTIQSPFLTMSFPSCNSTVGTMAFTPPTL